MITEAIVVLIAILIGYYLGHHPDLKEDIYKDFETIRYKGKEVLKEKSDLQPGIIRRPTADQLASRNEDEQTKAGKDAMRETLKDIIPSKI